MAKLPQKELERNKAQLELKKKKVDIESYIERGERISENKKIMQSAIINQTLSKINEDVNNTIEKANKKIDKTVTENTRNNLNEYLADLDDEEDEDIICELNSLDKNEEELDIENLKEFQERMIYENFIYSKIINTLVLTMSYIFQDIEKELTLLKIEAKKNLSAIEFVWLNILTSKNIVDESTKNAIEKYLQKWEELNNSTINNLLSASRYKEAIDKLQSLIDMLKINEDIDNLEEKEN